MTSRRIQAWVFWCGWVLAGALGMGIGWTTGWLIDTAVAETIADGVAAVTSSFAIQHIVQRTLNGAVIGAAIGLILGAGQWLVLRCCLRNAGWWVVASAVGWAAGWALAQTTGRTIAGSLQQIIDWPRSSSEITALVGMVAGTIIGSAQWPILRGKVRTSGWWIVASIIGAALLWLVASSISGRLNRTDDPDLLGPAVSWAIGGAAAGALTGAVAWQLISSTARGAGQFASSQEQESSPHSSSV
ncbi:MAG: hypothetical protein KatS3mg057_1352 [Herpetosiphonaceae bacterium]|nr:MAG: hypothetical protein KatS3mg057_1352 [Herpetosiphonaceae bacterium]